MRSSTHSDTTSEIVQRLCATHQRQMVHLKTGLQKELFTRYNKGAIELIMRDSVDIATGTTSTEFHGFPALSDDEKWRCAASRRLRTYRCAVEKRTPAWSSSRALPTA